MSDEPQEPQESGQSQPGGSQRPPARRYRSARELYSPNPTGGSPVSAALRAPRPRSGRRRVLIAIAVLAVLIVLASLRHHPDGSIPSGRWGLTIACLQRNALFSIADASTGNATGRRTTAVEVSDAKHHTLLADIRHYRSAAAARSGRSQNALKAPRADYLQDGSDLWAWVPGGTPPHLLSNVGERTIISSCVRTPPT